VWLANGGHELLFNLRRDASESRPLTAAEPARVASLRAEAIRTLAGHPITQPAVEDRTLKALSFGPFPRTRIEQFARGITDCGQGALPPGVPPAADASSAAAEQRKPVFIGSGHSLPASKRLAFARSGRVSAVECRIAAEQ